MQHLFNKTVTAILFLCGLFILSTAAKAQKTPELSDTLQRMESQLTQWQDDFSPNRQRRADTSYIQSSVSELTDQLFLFR